MNGVFQALRDEKQLNDWANLFDWLFDDDRFDERCGWTGGYIGAFTKKTKKLFENFGVNYNYASRKELTFSRASNHTMAFFSKGDKESEGRDLVRHIRNGIAHGRTVMQRINDELYIEIKDFKDSSMKTQTALFFFPLSYIMKIYDCYKKTEQQIQQKRLKESKKGKNRTNKKEKALAGAGA